MIRYFRHSEIDKKRWDNCIENSINSLVYASSWFLDVVSPAWDALILDDYKAVMPLTWKKKFGITYLVQPAFCQQLGVFGDDEATADAGMFIRQIPGKYLSVRIHLNEKNKIVNKGIKIIDRTNYSLSLNRSYDELFSNYSSIHKKNIKTGRNRNFSIQKSADLTWFYNFFLKNHRDRFVLGDPSYDVLGRLFLSIGSDLEYAILYASTADSKIVAAIFLLKSFNRWILMLTPSTEYGRVNRAIYLLIDKFIQEHAGESEILDFEGSNIKGVAEFFSGFGAEAGTYNFIKYRRIPFIP